MRDGKWKLFLQEATDKEPALEGLFNLEHDPGEKVNLAPAERERVASMKAKLVSWEHEVTQGVTRKT